MPGRRNVGAHIRVKHTLPHGGYWKACWKEPHLWCACVFGREEGGGVREMFRAPLAASGVDQVHLTLQLTQSSRTACCTCWTSVGHRLTWIPGEARAALSCPSTRSQSDSAHHDPIMVMIPPPSVLTMHIKTEVPNASLTPPLPHAATNTTQNKNSTVLQPCTVHSLQSPVPTDALRPQGFSSCTTAQVRDAEQTSCLPAHVPSQAVFIKQQICP